MSGQDDNAPDDTGEAAEQEAAKQRLLAQAVARWRVRRSMTQQMLADRLRR